jgi:L-ascorbate metabolism protein UlaG (beta-lactamase superfamily)
MSVHAKRICASAAFMALALSVNAWAQNVKITPLGTHPGELCGRDRATIFEDPTGVRILYDAGQSVTGADDSRLGDVHVILLSHAHGDHIGESRLKAIGAGSCASADVVSAAPNSTTAEIAAAKNAAVVTTQDMSVFLSRKIQNIKGKPVPVCQQTAGATTVPVSAPCRSGTHLGGTFTAKTANAERGIDITIVYASHANNLPLSLVSEQQRPPAGADDIGVSVGPPVGYVVKFTNGLTVYLSGDSGIHSEMKTIVNEFHKANLAQFNLGLSAITATSAAYAMNELVRPASVIMSHTNEASTEGGKLRAGSLAAAFSSQLKGRPAYPALSGRTMEFDGRGRCVSGCQ